MNAAYKKRLDEWVKSGLFVPCLVIVFLFIIGEVILQGFASMKNIANIMASASLIASVALCQMFVMVVGDGIDLSVGAVMSMAALMFAKTCNNTTAMIVPSLLLVLSLGGVVGLINYAGITFLNIPPMIITMIMGIVVNGFNYFYTKGIVSGAIPYIVRVMGKQVVGPLKTIMFVVVVLFILIYLFMRKTRTGRSIYLVGSNKNAADNCGLKSNVIILVAYVLSGVLAAFTGVLLLGMNGAAVLKMGDDYVMMSVAAAVIGGVKAGEGKILGCYLGGVIIQLITNVLIAANLSDALRIFIQGLVLLAILSTFARRPRLQS